MAEYHVGCGFAGIYAGTINPKSETWRNKSDVTNEAINAVVQHMYFQIPEGENFFKRYKKCRIRIFSRFQIFLKMNFSFSIKVNYTFRISFA